MSTEFPDALPRGTALRSGDFIIEDVLGQGGFGITYRATDTILHRDAAIKEFFPRGSARDVYTKEVLAPSPTEFQSAKEQFLIEARALARFNHAHIVDVYSIFEDNGTAYMVMEFVRGSTLTQTVETHGALGEEEAILIIEQVGSALGEVHRAGLVHLDIKPDNVIIEESTQRAVLLDFGLTKKIESASGYGTMRLDAWSRFGTPGFAAIEQYSERSATGIFTDVYSLAATLYFLLTAQAPPDAAARATGTALPDVRSLNPRVSTPAVQAIERALRLPAEERPQSIEEFLHLLHRQEPTPQLPVQVIPPHRPAPEYSEEPSIFLDPFDVPHPRPTPRRRSSSPRDVYNDPMADLRGPLTFLPFSFGCSGIGCSLGCFIFILIFFSIIGALLNSVGSVFIF